MATMTKRGPGRPRETKSPRGAFADSLRRARAVRGMTQREAALDVGVHPVTWARWETGAAHPSGPALRFVLGWIDGAASAGGSDGK